MKAGWSSASLADLVSFRSGLWTGKKGPFSTVKVIRNTNIQRYGRLSLDDVAEIKVETKQLESRCLKHGDIILERSGGGPKQAVGRAVCFELDDENFSFSNFTSRIRIRDRNRLSFKFLHMALNWWYETGVTEKIQSNSTGIRNLDFNAYKALELPVPPMEEQQRIVAILDEAFEGLDRARANTEANLQNARELYAAYLREIFAVQSKGWPQHTLMDVCAEFGRGKSKHRPRNDPALYGGSTPFIQTGDLSDATHFITQFRQTYSAIGVSQSKLWPRGTVCIAIVGATIGESGILEFDACFPDSVIGMVPRQDKVESEYIEYLLQFMKSDLKEAGKGSARDNINLATFENRRFPIPNLTVQRIVIDRLNELAASVGTICGHYVAKNQELDNLRQSLLQKAFAGELT